MDKQNVVYLYNGGIHSVIIGEIYSAIKQNELSIHTHTQSNLKFISLSERSQVIKCYVLYCSIVWHSEKENTMISGYQGFREEERKEE